MNGELTEPDTACVYYPHLKSKILEVRERVQGPSHFAFLQARNLVTVESSPEAQIESMEHKARWEFVAAGRSDGDASKMGEGNPRLSALKNLQQTVETQGVLGEMWSQWEGSWMLNTDH